METADKAEAASPPRDDAKRSDRIAMVTASTDPNRALADIAQQRASDQRRNTRKRAAQAVVVLGVLAAALLIPRFREHGRAAAPAIGAASVASRAKSTPEATATAAPLAPADREQATQALVTMPQDPPAQCEGHFKAHQWRGAIESCSVAFETSPTAVLAMRVAHAHWAHGDAAGAGTWAQQALDLESTDPDAYVLIGNAEHAAGKRRKAVAAYKHYLELAPRGWHAARLRAYMHGTPATSAQP